MPGRAVALPGRYTPSGNDAFYLTTFIAGLSMKLRRLISALVSGMALSVSAHAAERDPFSGPESLLTPQVLLSGLVNEKDVSLLFAHLRASMLATAGGQEPPPMPAELSQRLDTAGGELRVRGTLIGLALSQVMERAIRDAVRDFSQQAPGNTD